MTFDPSEPFTAPDGLIYADVGDWLLRAPLGCLHNELVMSSPAYRRVRDDELRP